MAKKNIIRPDSRSGGLTILIVGLCLIAPSLIHNGLSGIANGGMAFAGLICTGLGLLGLGQTFLHTRQLPKKEVMRLAQSRQGILSLSEIATALDINPDRAKRTLQALAKDGIATQRWQEYRKNLWEFPDYMTLPISESIELAKSKGGHLSIQDLLNSGHTPETARQTLRTLSEKGLAQEDPSGSSKQVIVTTQ